MSRSRVTGERSLLPRNRRTGRAAGPGPGPGSGRRRAAAPRVPVTAGGRGLRERRRRRGEGGPRSERGAAGRGQAGGCPRPALPADGVRLVGLRLRRAGGGGRRRRLRQGRQRPFSSSRSSLRWLSRTRCLPAVQRSKECVAFPRGVWNPVCCYGHEILQLQKGNAWDNCWCQFTDGWTAWAADDGKASLSHKSASSHLKMRD